MGYQDWVYAHHGFAACTFVLAIVLISIGALGLDTAFVRPEPTDIAITMGVFLLVVMPAGAAIVHKEHRSGLVAYLLVVAAMTIILLTVAVIMSSYETEAVQDSILSAWEDMSFSRRNNFHNSTAELTDEFLFNEHRTGYVAATTAVFLVLTLLAAIQVRSFILHAIKEAKKQRRRSSTFKARQQKRKSISAMRPELAKDILKKHEKQSRRKKSLKHSFSYENNFTEQERLQHEMASHHRGSVLGTGTGSSLLPAEMKSNLPDGAPKPGRVTVAVLPNTNGGPSAQRKKKKKKKKRKSKTRGGTNGTTDSASTAVLLPNQTM